MKAIRSMVLVSSDEKSMEQGAGQVFQNLQTELKAFDLTDEVSLSMVGDIGRHDAVPMVIVYPEGTFYSHVRVEDVDEIVTEHLLKGRIVKHLLYKDKDRDDEQHLSLESIGFYRKQMRIVLRNCGVIDPENIDEYIAFDGYKALEKVLTSMKPEEVIQIIMDSGLRGRGGAGFPTGLKWKFAAASKSDQKYMVCNADEGDPGAFMDRSGSHDHRRLCHRRDGRGYLRARGVPHRGETAGNRH